MSSDLNKVAIALGSNLGDRAANISAAIEEIGALPGTRILARASIIETEPVDAPPPNFLNTAILIETPLAPLELLDAVQAIERKLGRPENHGHNTPRTVDVDLITYGEVTMKTSRLTLPHPRAHLRDFVIEPLKELGISLEPRTF